MGETITCATTTRKYTTGENDPNERIQSRRAAASHLLRKSATCPRSERSPGESNQRRMNVPRAARSAASQILPDVGAPVRSTLFAASVVFNSVLLCWSRALAIEATPSKDRV